MNVSEQGNKVPILYLAPWIDYGGTDKNTIDWFRGIDRDRFAPSLIVTQPSLNRRLEEISEYVDETWVLPDLMPAEEMPAFILDFVLSREIQVVHLMNSRLGFDLLPDITSLPDAPGIVVQLHVEEADRSGYVRYVTTRYGNLVDRFSVTSEHLANAVHEYGIPQDRTKVIYIGVDAESEFSPEEVDPIEGLADDRLHILFPARVVQQKDPLLMVEVAGALRDRGIDFQIHVLGEGDLEDAVRTRVGELDLQDHVLLHPPTPTPQRWYAACDAVLLTSEFEGVPAVVFEAMAMGLPIVASALPGNSELLGEGYDGLVEPRDSVEDYVVALARLAEDEPYREAHGRELRSRALEKFSLAQMADQHGELYDEVIAEHDRPERELSPPEEPIRFIDRPLFSQELVSILVPHFNQARFLGECIDSIWAQTYPNVELIVVDDCSTERDAAKVLDELESHDDVTVLRLDRNGGPSRARNLGLEHCSGRYILPVDSDNTLLPDAVERLVEQLSTAAEDVGFIYPNLQFFGNREEYYEPPEYNLYTLLHGNFCDTCSLIDRGVFDAGLRYREEIVLGHEDWEFVLRLAAHGIRGEAANVPTLRYRKWGFNRSDAVEHAPTPFDEVLAEFSPFVGREEQIKSEEAPSVSIACLRPIPDDGAARQALGARLARQSCSDVELIAVGDGEWPGLPQAPQLRRLPSGAADDPLQALQRARREMRGSLMVVSDDPELEFLADPGFVEKVLRRFATAKEKPDAIAFVDAGEEARFGFRALAPEELDPGAAAHAVVWRVAAEDHLPYGLHVDPERPADSIARLFSGNGACLEWRHAAGSSGAEPGRPSAWKPVDPRGPDAVENALVQPLLPGAGKYTVPRWDWTPTWIPPISTVLVRYKERHGERRLISSDPPPSGYVLERHLGVLRCTAFEGTERLLRVGEDFVTFPRGEWQAVPDDGEELGYVELAPFPQLNCLAIATYRPTGQRILVSMPDDPLLAHSDVVEVLGFLEPFPIKPEFEPLQPPPLDLVGLVKTVDHENRVHRYAVDGVPPGELVGELGALAASELEGAIGAWVVDGKLVTDRHSPPAGRSTAMRATRWALEPAAWQGIATAQARAKTALRRSSLAATQLARPAREAPRPNGRPAGWLYPDERPGLSSLYAAYHPVTGDQLLTRTPDDGPQMGYEGTTLLGFVRLLAPVTGDLQQRAFPVPWARRFGAVPRTG